MMPPFVVFPTNRIAHFVEVSLYLFYLAQQVKLGNLTLKQIIGLTSQQYKFRLFTFILSPKAELVNEFV